MSAVLGVPDLTVINAPSARRQPVLPYWPLLIMFGLMPLWWALGAFYLAWPLFGLLLLGFLAIRGNVQLPTGSVLWLVFLGLVLISFTQLDRPTSLLTAGFRFAFYATAFVVLAYVYNMARERGNSMLMWRPLCYFWLGLVALGWLGVLAPQFTMASPLQVLLPGSLTAEPFIFDMVHLATAEPQTLELNPRYRPAAPYAYTNTWGSTWALLMPCIVAYLMCVRRSRLRALLLLSVPLSLVPAFLTLNRIMFVSLAAGLAVVAIRALIRGDRRLVLAILSLIGVGWAATLFIPVMDLIEDRVATSGTNDARMFLYAEVLQRVGESPLLGYGAPVSVDVIDAPPIGSQGQLWLVLFSHGIPALVVFVSWFLAIGARSIGSAVPAIQWLGAVPVIALVQMPFYGLTFQNLTVTCYACGLMLAAVDGAFKPRRHFDAPVVDDQPLQGRR